RLLHPEALDLNNELRQTASVEYNRGLSGGKLGNGNWATSLIWGRKHKQLDNTVQNSYLLESTLNFLTRNYAYTRLELVDKDELFPEAPVQQSYRIGAYTFGGVRDLLHSKHWQIGLGGDVTFYSKPAALDAIYGSDPVSFHLFVRIRPGLMEHPPLAPARGPDDESGARRGPLCLYVAACQTLFFRGLLVGGFCLS